MAENHATGEQTVTLGTKTYRFIPTFKAVNEIEKTAGMGLRSVGERIVRESHLGLLALCLWAFNTNGGERKTRNIDFFGNLIVEYGHLQLIIPVSKIIAGVCLRGASTPIDDEKKEKKVDADEEEEESTDDAVTKSD